MSAASIITSVVTGGSNNHATVSEEVNAYATDFVTQGVVGTIGNTAGASPATGGFAVNQDGTPDMGVTITAGVAYVTGTPSGQDSQVLRARMSSNYTAYTINANSSGSTKYDWIYLQLDATAASDPSAAADDVITLYTSRSTSNTSDTGSPPTYGLLLAVVTVSNGASSITNANVSDRRVNTALTTSQSASNTGWLGLGYAPNTVTALGNRSYSLVFNNLNLTTTVSNGMRLRTTRTVAAPTQCTSLNGSTQYYSKSSPAGMTFTDDFVVGGWTKPAAYGTALVIASRFNGTSGWVLRQEANGTISLTGYNAGVANYSQVVSYQSVPINKQVWVAAQLDMSAFTATTTTSYIMIDGVDVPASVGRGGTNPTALVQAGNLEIGANNGGLLPYNGKLAQIFIFGAKVTQATLLSYMSQGLAGTETSLISAYSFNNSITDLNANANNLTANGSAVATNADSPFGGQADGTISSTLDYGIIQSATFSTNTTLVVQVPEGCTIPTSGGVSAVSYSTQKAPYAFPADSGKWTISMQNLTTTTVAGPAANTWYNSGNSVTVPLGAWSISFGGMVEVNSSTSTTNVVYATLSTANNTNGGIDSTISSIAATTASAPTFGATSFLTVSRNYSVATTVYLNLSVSTTPTNIYLNGGTTPTLIRATNAYL